METREKPTQFLTRNFCKITCLFSFNENLNKSMIINEGFKVNIGSVMTASAAIRFELERMLKYNRCYKFPYYEGNPDNVYPVINFEMLVF